MTIFNFGLLCLTLGSGLMFFFAGHNKTYLRGKEPFGFKAFWSGQLFLLLGMMLVFISVLVKLSRVMP